MGFLCRLLGVDVPPGTTIEDLDLQLRSSLPWFVVILIAVLLAALVVVVYRFERARVHFLVRLLLAAVRTAAVLLLLLLLCRPVLQATFVSPRQREILLLIDNTQSMKQRDRRFAEEDLDAVKSARWTPPANDKKQNPSREELVRAILNDKDLDLLAGLQKHGPVVPMLFGTTAKSAVNDFKLVSKRQLTAKDVLEKFTAAEPDTALADVIKTHLQRKDGELPAAIVVMTDGLDTPAAKYRLMEAARACADVKVPLHIYGVGAVQPTHVKIGDVLVNDTLFAKDKVPVTVSWRADGVTKGTAVVSVTLDGKTLEKTVPVAGGQEQHTSFTFLLPEAKKKGEVQNTEVKAEVRLVDQDLKDTHTHPVRIVDGKVKVLFVENLPRRDFMNLKQLFIVHPRIELHFWLLSAESKAAAEGPVVKAFPDKKELNQYDVVILGDVPPEKLGKKQRELLVNYVDQERGGLLVLAGKQNMPGAYTSPEYKDFVELLPVDFVKHTFPIDGPGSPLAYQPKRTEDALRAKWLMLDDEAEKNDKLWQDLPGKGMYWFYPVVDLRPGAEVLLEHPTAKMVGGPVDLAAGSKDKQAMPLLAWHRLGKGQVMFVGFEESWRWSYDDGIDEVVARFWSQVIVRLGLQHKGVGQVELEHGTMTLGKPGFLHARLLKSNFDPLTMPKVGAKLKYLGDKAEREEDVDLELVPVPGKTGVYRAGAYRVAVPNDRPGLWQLTLKEPASAVLTYNVKVPPGHELKEAPLAAGELTKAANETKAWGGRFYREKDLKEMVAAITPQETIVRSRQEVLLWGWIPFVLFVGLVTLEWLGRKFANLS